MYTHKTVFWTKWKFDERKIFFGQTQDGNKYSINDLFIVLSPRVESI